MRRYSIAIAATIFALSGCSSDSGEKNDNNGAAWEFDGGGGDASQNNGGANNGATNNVAVNNGSTNNQSTNNGSTNNQSTNNTSTNNQSTNNGSTNNSSTNNGSTNNSSTNNNSGNGNEGDACALNSECSADLICCAGFDGMGTCETDCLSGGLCGGDEGECSPDTECCDLSGIGAPDSCLQMCRGGNNGGGGGTPCDTNPDCTTAGEVCCIGFDGNGTCEPEADCFTGGACESDMDCDGMQECCDFQVAKVCFDQCSF